MSHSRIGETSGTVGELRPSSVIRQVRPPRRQDFSKGGPAETRVRGENEGKVDDVLETLHRSLKNQETVQRLLSIAKKTPSKQGQDIVTTLSGASTHAKPPRRITKRRATRVKESRAISSARCLVSAAESLGLDMSTAKLLISSSEKKNSGRKHKAAATDAAKALAHAKHAASVQLQAMLPELEAKVRNLRANGGRAVVAEKGLVAARTALKGRNYRTAIVAVSGTKRAISEGETAFIRKILNESKGKFVSAKKAGVNIDTAVRALIRAKEHLREGDLGSAVSMATKADTAVEVTIRAHHDASRSLAVLARTLAVTDQVDADVTEGKRTFRHAKALFEEGAYFKSAELSKEALGSVGKILESKIQESVARAERAVALGREAGAPVGQTEAKLNEARLKLSEREYSKSLALANEVLVEGTSAALTVLGERVGGIGQFAKSVAGEIESLSQVQDAIVHSRERSLEMVRKYSSMSEDVVSQAYDNAASYMRVSQDIVRQAYDSSIALDPDSRGIDSEPRTSVSRSPTAQILGIAAGDRKLRIIDLYLSGRIDDRQLDKLLSLVDSGSSGIEISDGGQEAQIAKR